MTTRRNITATLLALLAVLATALVGRPALAQSAVAAQDAAPEFSATKEISRVHRVDGHDDVVEKKDFTLTVDKTSDLRFFQEINVTWSGAHPTGGIVADPNSGDAKQEEYPVVLLECSGVDGPDAPAGKRVDPTTCWTATAGERFASSFNTAFPPWRLDRFATPEERKAIVGQPDPRPSACFSASPAERWVPFRTPSGTVFEGGSSGCAGMAPEAANVGGLSVPSNTTYAVTNADGTGSANFTVWTAENNASLGCSSDVACSLVAVPILGVSCDPAGTDLPAEDQPSDQDQAAEAAALCESTGNFEPGQVVVPAARQAPAVAGELWWSPSNWRNRITVPLHFAPSSNVCEVVGGNRQSLDVYGSELMTQATLQWLPKFCLDSNLFNVKHVQTGETAARSLLESGGVDAVFSSDVPPDGFAKPVVNAPVALTGFAVAYTIDDADGRSLATLRLTPRLLAKLLTESYPAINTIKSDYSALKDNPLNVSLDPEFIALNPSVKDGVAASESASTLLTISSDSDVTLAMTRYINSDPDARSWLDGQPDPWGMVVNPNYRNIALPLTSWPLLDTFEPTRLYESGTNDCLKNSPVPYLPLVAAPLARLNPIAQAMQFSLAKSQIVCSQVAEGTSDGEKLVALGRQTRGFRFMLGVVSLGDARRFALPTASLQTAVDAGAPAKFDSTEGRNFVAPSDDSILAAGHMLQPDAATATWPIPYAAMRTDAGKSAYPGTMLVYAQAPTTGLAPDDASRIATFLTFASGDAQRSGSTIGTLPPGYVPLTAENGFGALSAYTESSAKAVLAQDGTVPPVIFTARQDAGATATLGASTATSTAPGVSGGRVRVSAGNRSSGPLASVLGAVPAPVRRVVKAVVGTTVGVVAHLVAALFPLLIVVALVTALSAAGLGLRGVAWRRLRRRLGAARARA